MEEPKQTLPPQPNGKAAWIARSDRGPHTAELPSGQVVRFVVPQSNELIRANKLPDHLTEIALMATAYIDGADGYMGDLAMRAVTDPDQMARVTRAVREGLELRDWLVATMLVEPAIEPDDVRQLPEADVRMLLEFAERKRNEDAKGVRLPIVVLDEYDRFRDEPSGDTDDGAGGGDSGGLSRADTEADGVSM
jgi:hypothetical protein